MEQSLLLYENIIKNLPIGLTIWHLEDLTDVKTFKLVIANPAAINISGLPLNEMIGKSIGEIYPSLLETDMPQIYAEVIRSGISQDLGEVYYSNESIPHSIFSAKAFPILQKCVGIIVEDITDRKQIAELLQESQNYAEVIVETVREPLLVLDNNLRIKSANRSFYKVFKLSPRQIKNKYIYAVGKGEWDIPKLRTYLEEIIQKNTYLEDFDVNQDFPEIGHKIILINAFPINHKGALNHLILVIMEDITKRKQAENELNLSNAKLAQSNQELQEFASIASHDLQEPLRKVQAFGDRLKNKFGDILSDEGKDYLDRMQNAAKRMQVLINDLLTFSRVTTKAQPFTKVNLSEIIQDVITDLEVHLQEVNGRVEFNDLVTIDAEPLQMRQLFQNLISNGLKFHRQDESPIIKITTKLFNNSSSESLGNNFETQFCQIIVEDNGIGFDEKYLDRIFTVFQRLHSHNQYQGTGIGLAICRKIAERHGGTITAKSMPQQGSKFIVTLPVKQSIRE